MFMPLYDVNRLRYVRRQWVVLAIIAANIVVTLILEVIAGPLVEDETTLALGYIPAVVNDLAALDPALVWVPEEATFVTYSFVHAGWGHLIGNLVFLWVFGDNVEDATGHLRFILFYAACAAAGAFAHGLMEPESQQPLVGASGAVAGISAAYLVLHPKVRVWVLVLGRIPLPLPAWIPLGLWVGTQFVMIVTDVGGQISWAAHVGGIAAGAALIPLLKRRDVPLFDRRIEPPDAAVLAPVGDPPTTRWGRASGG